MEIELWKIYTWVLMIVGVVTLIYFFKIFALVFGLPLAIHEIVRTIQR